MNVYILIMVLILLLIIIYFIDYKEEFETNTYVFNQGYNSNDNLQNGNLSNYANNIDKLSNECNNLSNCVGFTNNGILKNGNSIFKDPLFTLPNDGIYIKKDYYCDPNEMSSELSSEPTSSIMNTTTTLAPTTVCPTHAPTTACPTFLQTTTTFAPTTTTTRAPTTTTFAPTTTTQTPTTTTFAPTTTTFAPTTTTTFAPTTTTQAPTTTTSNSWGSVAKTTPLINLGLLSKIDQNNNCSYWANIGECNKNPNYMLSMCALSCDKFNKAVEDAKTSTTTTTTTTTQAPTTTTTQAPTTTTTQAPTTTTTRAPTTTTQATITKVWDVIWTAGIGSIMLMVGNNQALHLNIRDDRTVMSAWDGSRWGPDVWDISQFHNNNRNRNPPLRFKIIFNTTNGFTINYQDKNIATYPNKFNITNADDLIPKVEPISGINVTELKTTTQSPTTTTTQAPTTTTTQAPTTTTTQAPTTTTTPVISSGLLSKIDKNNNCPYLALSGECKKNPNYMLNTCALSCDKFSKAAEEKAAAEAKAAAELAESLALAEAALADALALEGL
jgi:hypothetical protein